MTANYGDPRLPDRFWDKVYPEPNTGCWLWGAAVNDNRGYGRFGYEGRMQYAHRISYQVLMCPIPEAFVVDHLCRTPSCINPLHLEAVSHGTNTRRGRINLDFSGLCSAGLHDITKVENLYVPPSGERTCRVCLDARACRRARCDCCGKEFAFRYIKEHRQRVHKKSTAREN